MFRVEALGQDEFRTLVLRELDSVYRLAHHLTHSAEESDDLVQETYLRALRFRASFQPGERGPRPWLFKILHNVHKDRIGKRQRESGTTDIADNDAAAPPAAPPSAIDWEQVDERLKRAVDSLPPAHRSVLLMWAVEGLKYKEIAEIVEAPIGTVMSRLFRARQSLLDQVGELGAELRLTPPAERGGMPTSVEGPG
ncbi:MAG TPA: sigma-70 family RNA polymerase sigma factor [Tepidisphaeraceae bacterium]|nr:sigma-70 family RNA polymerase sigma factor [Tepidisphaeraceae bacterium]